MHLLQVCNVGDICGGTAACAWTIARAVPASQQTVIFPSPPTAETSAAFRCYHVEVHRRLSTAAIASLRPDVVLLHNVPASRGVGRSAPLTIQYVHSRIAPAEADVTVACSRWLEAQLPAGCVAGVLHQPAPKPPQLYRADSRALRKRLVVGRLCTPVPRKWPPELAAFYTQLAAGRPWIDWEFIGCPPELQPLLRAACQGRAVFLPAGWKMRQRLHHWDALLYHHPTLTESFGRTAAEAMRCGCIPIVDDRGGFREQITRQSGFLCASPTEFASALDQLQVPELRRRMSRAAVAHADGAFSLESFYERFRRLLLAATNDLLQTR